jgi:hypothetical protein
VSVYLHCLIEALDARDVAAARRQLQAFCEAARPAQDYGLVIFEPACEDCQGAGTVACNGDGGMPCPTCQ